MTDCCDNNRDLISILNEKSIRITPSKIDTLQVFFESKIPIGSKDILEKLNSYNESTIFRNITKFKQTNILKEIDLNEGYKRYALVQRDHHHHYAKCQSCAEITQLDSCNISPIEKELKKKGFKIEAHSIEIFGICSNCL